MTPEEFKVLGDKVANGSATPEERLLFFKELNAAVVNVRENLKRAQPGQ